jgi:RNA polymerase sigma-70 factor (ECF subfamily)
LDEERVTRSTPDPAPAENTVELLRRIREGDAGARNRLIERYFDALHRWARGRLPGNARAEMNTEDLVQEVLIRALQGLETFQWRETGSFLAYLRQILKNRIRDELRKVQRRPRTEELVEDVTEDAPSPFEQAIDRESWERYEAALSELPPQQQEGVIMRVELQFTHQQVADALGLPTANAARMMLSRAIAWLAERISHE